MGSADNTPEGKEFRSKVRTAENPKRVKSIGNHKYHGNDFNKSRNADPRSQHSQRFGDHPTQSYTFRAQHSNEQPFELN